MRIIAIANRKGGVGKTTIADILGLFFLLLNKFPSQFFVDALQKLSKVKVLFIDFDSSNCTLSKKYVKMEPCGYSSAKEGWTPDFHPDYVSLKKQYPKWSGKCSTADIFFEDRVVIPYPTSIENIDIIPAFSPELEQLDDIKAPHIRSELFDKIVKWVSHLKATAEYDIVIIDTPPVKNNTTRAALKISTDLLIPTILDAGPVDGVYGMLQVWSTENMLRESTNRLNLLGIVANLYDRRSLQDVYYEQLQRNATAATYMFSEDLHLHKYKDYGEHDHVRMHTRTGNFFDKLTETDLQKMDDITYDKNEKTRKAQRQAFKLCREISRRLENYGEI